MKTYVKKILENEAYKRIWENFLSLSSLQIASYILPLITLPYLVRVLGPGKYGLIAFAASFVGYFQILTDYGFNLSATREISINRQNKEKISEIVSSVILIKTFLMLLSLIVISIIVFSFKIFRNEWLIYFLTFGTVIGNVIFPVWFFQGIEKMKYITILNLTSRIIFTIAIFIFIKEVADYIYVPLINSLGFIIAGILGLWITLNKYDINLKLPQYKTIKFHLREGWHIFISQAAVSLYTTSNAFILGLFTTTAIVGYYSAAEKVVLAVLGLISTVSQTVYPHISRLVAESKEKGLNFIRKIAKLISIFGIILSSLLFIFAGLIVNILFGSQYYESITVIRLLALLPLIVGLGNVFGTQTMLTFNYKSTFSKIILIGGILNIGLAFILVPIYKDIGIATSYLLAESFITLMMFMFLQHKNIKIFGS